MDSLASKSVCSEKVTRSFSVSSWLRGVELVSGTRQSLDLNVVFLRDDVEDMLALVRNESN